MFHGFSVGDRVVQVGSLDKKTGIGMIGTISALGGAKAAVRLDGQPAVVRWVHYRFLQKYAEPYYLNEVETLKKLKDRLKDLRHIRVQSVENRRLVTGTIVARYSTFRGKNDAVTLHECDSMDEEQAAEALEARIRSYCDGI